MRLPCLRRVLCGVFIAALFVLSASTSSAKPSNKWRIQVSEGANSDGVMIFRVAPPEGEAIAIEVTIADGTSENRIASEISAAFKSKLPEAGYKVEVDDGEDVLVKAKSATPDFDLIFVSSTVKSVRIHIDRE